MKKLTVARARKLIVERPVVVHKDETLPELVLAITTDPKTRSIYVVDDDERLIGMITIHDIINVAFPTLATLDTLGYRTSKLLSVKTAEDMVTGTLIYAKDDEPLEDVLRRMIDHNIEELPVVDDNLHVIGEINLLEMLIVWLEKLVTKGLKE